MTATARLFRVIMPVSNLDECARFYGALLDTPGFRVSNGRHYFDCGGVILAVLDVSQGGMNPTPGPKSLYFAVEELEPVHARAKALKALAPFKVHGESAGDITKRPWGERSFYVEDPWSNPLCFVEQGTVYIG